MNRDDSLLVVALELMLNRAIASSPSALTECEALTGRVLSLQFTDFRKTFYLLPNAAGVQLMTQPPGPVDAGLRGTLAAISALSLQDRPWSGSMMGAVESEGDPEVALRLRHLLRLAAPDWEAHLARFTGDVVAHAVGNVVRGGLQWLRRGFDVLGLDLAEYAQYEAKLVPDPAQAQEFAREVGQLQDDVAALTARVRRLRGESS